MTSGTFGTDAAAARRAAVAASGPAACGGRCGGARLARRFSGIFSGFGVTGPSRYSKPSLSLAVLVLDHDDAHVAAALELAEQHLVGERPS